MDSLGGEMTVDQHFGFGHEKAVFGPGQSRRRPVRSPPAWRSAPFSVAYEGLALEDGTMDVRALAPALLALSDIFRTANVTVNPQAPPVSLEIRASDRGSFEGLLDLSQPDFIGNLIAILSATGPTALANLLSIFIGGPQVTLGLFGLIKRLRGHQVARVEPVNVGTVRLVLDDGTVLEFPAEVLTLYQSVSIQRRAADVMAPLREEGVEAVRFRTDQDITISVEKEDLSAFDVPALPPVPLLDVTTELPMREKRIEVGDVFVRHNFHTARADELEIADLDREREWALAAERGVGPAEAMGHQETAD
jgi:hypothetical protein